VAVPQRVHLCRRCRTRRRFAKRSVFTGRGAAPGSGGGA
jgi:hypothetical protein